MVDEPKTLLQRLNAVQGECSYVQKEKKQGMRYSIVSHDAVTALVRPLMVKWGVVYFPHVMKMEQVGNRTQIHMSVRFVNIDDKDDFIDVTTGGYGIDDQDKGPGKAISYSIKYALLKTLGLETGDDPDTEQHVTFRDDDRAFPQGNFAAGQDAAPSKSSAQLKREVDLQKEFAHELSECLSLPMLEKFRIDWKKIADKEGWNQHFRHAAQEMMAQQKDFILSQMSPENLAVLPLKDTLQASLRASTQRPLDDDFPGDVR